MSPNHNFTTTKISVDEIDKNWSTYLRRVEAGETLIITKAGKPIAEIKPATSAQPSLRPFGLCAGEFNIPDDFDAPLPEHIIRDFEG